MSTTATVSGISIASVAALVGLFWGVYDRGYLWPTANAFEGHVTEDRAWKQKVDVFMSCEECWKVCMAGGGNNCEEVCRKSCSQ